MKPALFWSALLVLMLGPSYQPAGEDQPPHGPGRVLVVVPLGDPSPKLVENVAGSLQKRFNFQVLVNDSVPLPRSAWYLPRKRWRAEKLLDFLDTLELGENVWRVAGITEEPISTTKGKRYDWGIAGLATIGGRNSVFSSWLFERWKVKHHRRYLRAMDNLVLHEVGHNLGLDHCPLKRCIMADAMGSARQAALQSANEFCPRCTEKLRVHLKDKKIRGKWSLKELAILRKTGWLPESD